MTCSYHVANELFLWAKGFYMAERRMFAKTIIDSDAFLDMPLSTQALYFHLSMRADDDGFLNNAKKIQRTVGANDDDFKVLLSKKFVIPFEDGICVIKHWLIHNYIQKDRYKETVYTEHKQKLSIKDNNVYTMDTECIQTVSSLEAQVRLGKVSLVKDNKNLCAKKSNFDDGFEQFWNAYPKKVGKTAAKKSWDKAKPDIDLVLIALLWQVNQVQWKKENGQFIPNPSTYINQGRWLDEMEEEEAPF